MNMIIVLYIIIYIMITYNDTDNTSNLKHIIDDLDNISDTESIDSVDDIDNIDNTYDDTIIGIDLGTTNSLVAIIKNNNYEIIPDEYGNYSIPSIVSFINTYKYKYVGEDAKNQLKLNPDNTFYEVKRLIGHKFTDYSVVNEMNMIAYKIVSEQNGNILLETTLRDKKYITPEEVSSFILRKLKHMAENYTGKKINKAVITVPAYFNDAQRQATKDASKIAGLKCIRVINEPTAAALMYGLQNKTLNNSAEKTILVYDLGGGTLDCSILKISDGLFEVLSSTGNTHLGGSDFDKTLITYCIEYFKKKNNIENITNVSSISFQKLRIACERAKKLLSTDKHATIAVKDFYNNTSLIIKVTRDLFVNLCRDLFILCLKPVEDSLKSADLSKDDIDEIILVGGSTNIPIIKDNLSAFFKGKKLNSSINPDQVVAAGAAIQAYILEHNEDPFSASVVLLDIVPLSLGVKTIGGEMNVIVPRNTRIPTTRKKRYTTDSDYETSVIVEIFEGERTMTKDNFKIGEFELSGIESAPRGIAEIIVSFNIDVNGIINVTATDNKNTENKKTLLVKCNKGRLTEDKIHNLVKESEENEMQDKLKRITKRLYYHIEDLCNNIQLNLKNENFKLKQTDIVAINTDIDLVLSWLKSKLYDQRPKKEYQEVIKRLEKKYGTLILSITKDSDNVKSINDMKTNITSTTVGNDDVDEDADIYEEIEQDEYKFVRDIEEDTKRKTKEAREYYIDLCQSLFDMINTDALVISTEHIQELKDYLNDNILWAHIKQQITIKDYEEKINEINLTCKQIMEQYNNNIFHQSNNDITKKTELEQLCCTLKGNIEGNHIVTSDDDLTKLTVFINSTLNWLLDNDMNNDTITDEIYQTKIDEINNMCNVIYESTGNINEMPTIVPNNNTDDSVIIIDKRIGTSIHDLQQKLT